MLWGKEINLSVGDKKVTSSAGQKKFTVQLEKHRFQTLYVPIQQLNAHFEKQDKGEQGIPPKREQCRLVLQQGCREYPGDSKGARQAPEHITEPFLRAGGY